MRGSVTEEVWVGESRIRFEPPDICHIEIVGTPEGASAVAIMDALDRFSQDKTAIFTLSNVARSGSFPPEARKLVAERMKNMPIRATAVFGANFNMRVLITLVFKVQALFRGEDRNPTRFFSTEAEARAWIDQQRAALRPRTQE